MKSHVITATPSDPDGILSAAGTEADLNKRFRPGLFLHDLWVLAKARVVSLLVFTGTFVLATLFAQIMLHLNGTI